jgi:hypothetical protein
MADLKERNIRVNVLSPGEAAGRRSSATVARAVNDGVAALALCEARATTERIACAGLFLDGRSALI